MHSANRVSDEKLDEHLKFLDTTDIFGISDHDLLFTKEAVFTQEELIAAAEMGDAIQAKVTPIHSRLKSHMLDQGWWLVNLNQKRAFRNTRIGSKYSSKLAS